MSSRIPKSFEDDLIAVSALLIPIVVTVAIGTAVFLAIYNLTGGFLASIRFEEEKLRLADILSFFGSLVGGLVGALGAYLVFKMGRDGERARVVGELNELSRLVFERLVRAQIVSFIETCERELSRYDPSDPADFAIHVHLQIYPQLEFDGDYKGEVARRLKPQWTQFKLTRDAYTDARKAISELYVDPHLIPRDIRAGNVNYDLAIAMLWRIHNFCRRARVFTEHLTWMEARQALGDQAEAVANMARQKVEATTAHRAAIIERMMPPEAKF